MRIYVCQIKRQDVLECQLAGVTERRSRLKKMWMRTMWMIRTIRVVMKVTMMMMMILKTGNIWTYNNKISIMFGNLSILILKYNILCSYIYNYIHIYIHIIGN